MLRLNAAAAAAGRAAGVRCATDVTGFGLLGHALGIARESRVSLVVRPEGLPLLPHARQLSATFQPGGLRANRVAASSQIAGLDGVDASLEPLLFDPQTSGGLLLCVPSGGLEGLLAALPEARVVGEVRPADRTPILLE
jgi:selenide,water dikinase